MTEDASVYCSAQLRKRDEDRWLAAQYAPPLLRRKLIALYALYCELRRIPAAVSEPPLGEIRLQWHRDAFDEIRRGEPVRRQPVIEAFAEAGLGDKAFTALLDEAIDANARPLYGDAFADVDDLFAWFSRVDGAIDEIAFRLSGGQETHGPEIRLASAAFGVAREWRNLAPHLEGQLEDVLDARWRVARSKLSALPDGCAPAIAHLYLTPAYLKRGGRAFPVLKRLLLFRAVAVGR